MRLRLGRVFVLTVVASLWLVITGSRVRIWQDERALWEEAVRESPLKPRPWNNLGRQRVIHGEMRLATEAFNHAVVLAGARPPIEAGTARDVAQHNRAALSENIVAWLHAP